MLGRTGRNMGPYKNEVNMGFGWELNLGNFTNKETETGLGGKQRTLGNRKTSDSKLSRAQGVGTKKKTRDLGIKDLKDH